MRHGALHRDRRDERSGAAVGRVRELSFGRFPNGRNRVLRKPMDMVRSVAATLVVLGCLVNTMACGDPESCTAARGSVSISCSESGDSLQCDCTDDGISFSSFVAKAGFCDDGVDVNDIPRLCGLSGG